MGYIKEPEGVDFMIQSKPLTDKERKEIDKFIQNYKAEKKAVTKSKTFLQNKEFEMTQSMPGFV